MWNGAAETLNAKPTPIRTMPSRIIGLPEADSCSRLAISGIRVVPDAPYTRAMPYSTKALAKPPTRRYLAAASCERVSTRE